jgi:hypothetical protein
MYHFYAEEKSLVSFPADMAGDEKEITDTTHQISMVTVVNKMPVATRLQTLDEMLDFWQAVNHT